MTKKNPIAFLFEHREKILEIIMDNLFNLENAWKQFNAELPKIRRVMNFTEFENYIVYVPLVDKEIRKFKDENERLKFEVQKLKADLSSRTLVDKGVRKFKDGKDLELEVRKLKAELKSKIKIQNLLNSKIDELYYENDSLKNDLEKTKEELKERLQQGWVMAGVQAGEGWSRIPKKIEGWSVEYRKNYFRLYKRINGKLQWVYLGKIWDEIKAREKIEKKLEEIESS
jgi:hypothetical protein